MDFHRPWADAKTPTNFLVGGTFGNLAKNLAFTRGQKTLAGKVCRQSNLPDRTPVAPCKRRDRTAYARNNCARIKRLDEIVECPAFHRLNG
jgi:hypothetical protein